MGAAGLSARKGHELHPIPRLPQRRAVPRSMEGDEDPTPIVLGKLGAGIEGHRQWRPVTRQPDERRLLPTATTDAFAVATVLGREDLHPLLLVEVAVGPAEVIARLDLHQLFCRQLRVPLVA